MSCSVGDYDQIKGVWVKAKELRRDDRLVHPNKTFTLRISWASPNEHRMPTFSSRVNRLRRHMSSITSSKGPKLPHTQSKRSLRCKITTATKELALAMAEHVALVISRFPLHLGKCQCSQLSSPYSMLTLTVGQEQATESLVVSEGVQALPTEAPSIDDKGRYFSSLKRVKLIVQIEANITVTSLQQSSEPDPRPLLTKQSLL